MHRGELVGGLVRAMACGVVLVRVGDSPGQVLSFSDVSVEAGVGVTHQVHPETGFPFEKFVGGGAVGDFDADGWQDFLYLSGGVEADRLFMNNGDGTFTDRASEWGVDAVHVGAGAVVGDVNGDGWADIYVTGIADPEGGTPGGYHRLYRNNGDGTFTDIADEAGVRHIGGSVPDGWQPSFGDVDPDGDLDIFVGGFLLGEEPQRLFLNKGDGTFVDGTESAGLVGWGVKTFLSALTDLNGDRLPDLVWVGDVGTSRVFMNLGGGVFEDRTADAWAISTTNGMGLAVGDVNGDLLADMYVTSITWPPQNIGGNVLLVNEGGGTFASVAKQVGVALGGWGWGTRAEDFDHNGHLDLVETNGFTGMGAGFAEHQSYLYLNLGGLEFVEAALETGLEHFGQGRGLATLDYDNDGDRDVLIFANGERLTLYRNDLSGPGIGSVRVALDTSRREGLAPDGWGSRVVLGAGGVEQARAIDGHPTHVSQSELAAHFGIGPAPVVDWIRVEWADGTFTTLVGIEAGARLEVVAPFHPADFDGDDAVTELDLALLIESAQGQSLTADHNGDGTVNVIDVVAFYVDWLSAP